jgi:hypothetical protein
MYVISYRISIGIYIPNGQLIASARRGPFLVFTEIPLCARLHNDYEIHNGY